MQFKRLLYLGWVLFDKFDNEDRHQAEYPLNKLAGVFESWGAEMWPAPILT